MAEVLGSRPVVPELLSPLAELLLCLECGDRVEMVEIAKRSGYPELGPDGWLKCSACGERYPLLAGTPRMLERSGQGRLAKQYPRAGIDLVQLAGGRAPGRSVRERTADSFAYEWSEFGQLRAEWHKNFLDYLSPLSPDWLRGKLVLDVGAGSGRHSAQAAQLGARVVAVDLGGSIDVARRNLPPEVLTVQADAERLPLRTESFDLVMSIGVLHHLPDTRAALLRLVRYVRPGGRLHVYLYWVPDVAWHRLALGLVAAARRVTVRLPHRMLHITCYPLAALLWMMFVRPYGLLRSRPAAARLARLFPLKTYADYPFQVLVNDQFDRFSAPIEQRFTQDEVWAMLEQAGLVDLAVLPNHGWIGDGRRP